MKKNILISLVTIIIIIGAKNLLNEKNMFLNLLDLIFTILNYIFSFLGIYIFYSFIFIKDYENKEDR